MGSSSRCVVERAGSRSTYPTKKIDEALDDEVLRQSGHSIVSDALQPVHTATTIRLRNGSVRPGHGAECVPTPAGWATVG
jgi:hypothetical protein